MTYKVDRYAELRRFLRRDRAEEEVDEELEHHLAMRAADNVAAGMSTHHALDDARRRFGDYQRIRHETADIDRSAIQKERRMELFDTVRRDVQHAMRAMLRRPSFTLVAIITLAIGIGGTTAIFALIDSVLLNPLPYASADRLVHVASAVPKASEDGEWGVSVAGYFHFVDNQKSFTSVGAYTSDEVNVMGRDGAQRISAAVVTSSLLDALSAKPASGRMISARDDAPGAPPVVMLGHSYWQKHYGGGAVVGTRLRINGAPAEIIGVAAKGLELPDEAVDIWVPFGLDRSAPPQNSHYLKVVGRLRDGVTADGARADLARLTSQFVSLFPGAYSHAFMTETGFSTKVVPLRDQIVGDIGRVLWLLFGAVAVVLMIACANVANLFLVRADSRRREIALRSALGAARFRLALHYTAESVVLCLGSALLAIALARAGLQLLLKLSPSGIPRLTEVHLGAPAIMLAFGCAVVAGVVFGLFPVMRSRASYDALRDGGRTSTASRSRHAVRSTLVVAQVALSLLLLGGAGLMLRSVRALRDVNPGVDPKGVLTFEIALPQSTYDTHAKELAFFRALTTRLESVPGVQRVGIGNFIPLRGDRSCGSVFFEGKPLKPGTVPPCVFIATAAPRLFEALGMQVRGRTMSSYDAAGPSDGIVVTEAFAKRFWPGEDAIGKGVGPKSAGGPYYHVVGVVQNARASKLSDQDLEAIFYPVVPVEGASVWGGSGATSVVVRTSATHPETLIPVVRRALADVDASIPLANPQTLSRIVAHSMQISTFITMLLSIAAAMSLLLSAVGLYGVISYIVDQRRAEMGVRLALGARASEVRALVMRQSLRLTIGGVVIGLFASFMLTRGMTSLLYGVRPADPATLGVVTIVLLGVAALASWIPAARAARVQPMQVLREE